MVQVSVIIPTYNRLDLLHEAIQSVLAQTYTDYEILLVDDGSTEDIPAALARWNTPVHYLRQEKSGVSRARNTGIAQAQGQYIAFLDSDDLFLPEKLSEQVQYLDSHPEAGLVYTCYLHVDEHQAVIGESVCEMGGHVFPECLLVCPIATPSVMIRRSVLDAVGLFDESMDLQEDIDLWCRVARRYEIGLIARPLTMVRFHSDRTPRALRDILVSHRKVILKARRTGDDFGTIAMRKIMSRMYFGYSRVTKHEHRRGQSLKLILLSLLYWPPTYLHFVFATLSNDAKRLRATIVARSSPYPLLSAPVNFLLAAPKDPALGRTRYAFRTGLVSVVRLLERLLPPRAYRALRSAWRALKR